MPFGSGLRGTLPVLKSHPLPYHGVLVNVTAAVTGLGTRFMSGGLP